MYPKNINANLHFSSEMAQFCTICGTAPRKIVSHYNKHHKECEIYVSRLSASMAEKARKRHYSASICDENASKMRALCYFCEEMKEFTPEYFYSHIRSHTGEYAFECTICEKSLCFKAQKCCNLQPNITNTIDSPCTEFAAFICLKCNYIQINEKNVIKHLKNEHEVEVLNEQYLRVALLPSFNSL